MRSRLRPTPAFVLAFIALCLALGGSAVAARSLISGSQIKNGSITSDDIKDGSLLAKDFKKHQLTAGPKGDTGAPGFPGAAGRDGTDGKDGKDGKDGTTPALVDRGAIVADAISGPLQSVDVAWIRSSPGTAAVLTLTFTRETDGLSAQFTQKLVGGTSYTHVVLTLYRTGTLSPQVVYDLQSAKLDDVDRDGDEETWTIRPTGKYSETTYSADGSSSKWCLNTVTTEIGC
jgi:hypothetical protein